MVVRDDEGNVRVQRLQFLAVSGSELAHPFHGVPVFGVGQGEKLGGMSHTDAPDNSALLRHDVILRDRDTGSVTGRLEFGQNSADV
jgi:hypothetical protein